MKDSKNIPLIILALFFSIIHIGNSYYGGPVEVNYEKIDGCDSVTKFCKLERGVTIQTKITVRGKPHLKVRQQRIFLESEETGEKFVHTKIFCGVPGKPDCHSLSDKFEDFLGSFSLQKGFFMEAGKLELNLYSKMGYILYTSTYTFV
ncbi:hypothetical protein MXB_168 [Myxobolus squamalis]|nr:hypothetical protein MXB_168 [Myxobolus squamalis]